MSPRTLLVWAALCATALGAPLSEPAAAAPVAPAAAQGPGSVVVPTRSTGAPYSTVSNVQVVSSPGGRHAPVRRTVVASGPHARVAGTTPPQVVTTGAFAGASGNSEAPPDTSIAVGNSEIVETVNSTMYVWSQSGGMLSSRDIASLLGAGPSNPYETDARVVFDSRSQRWFLSALLFDGNTCSGTVVVAVSRGLNPDPNLAGAWQIYDVVNKASGDLTDQPRIGLSNDKVLLSWDDYPGSSFSTCGQFGAGSSLLVIDKAAVVAGNPASDVQLLDGSRSFQYFAIVGVVAQGDSPTAYALFNDSPDLSINPASPPPPAIDVWAINGTPPSVSFRKSSAAIPPTSAPQPAAQPGGAGPIDPDDRLLGAVLQGNDIWASANDACPGNPGLACSRFFKVGVSGFTASTGGAVLEESFDPSTTGEIYPAVTFDSNHNLFAVSTHVTTSVFPSVDEWFLGATDVPASITRQQVKAGSGTFTFQSPPYRWGDYAGAALDPDSSGRIWLAGEYTPLAGNTSTWGTWIQPESGPMGNAYSAVTPFRVWDTRAATAVQCANPVGCSLGSGGSATVQITGVGAIPAGATAVVLNLTGISPSHLTYLSVAPAGSPGLGSTSNLNLDTGATQANLVTVALPASGRVAVFNSVGTVDVALDAEGYFTASATDPAVPGTAGTFHPTSPRRVCDTRGGMGTACSSATDNPLGPGQSRAIVVTGGAGGLPSDGTAAAAVFNLTAVHGDANTYLTAYPPNVDGSCSVPTTSNINVVSGQDLPTRVIVPIGTIGAALNEVCIYNSKGTINFVVDDNGWFGSGVEITPGALFHASVPARICDTRPSTGNQCTGGTISGGGTLALNVAATTGTDPAPPVAVIINTTGIVPTSGTFLTVFPAGPRPTPMTSDLNLAGAGTTANLVVVGVGPGSSVDIYNALGSVNVAVDIQGWFR